MTTMGKILVEKRVFKILICIRGWKTVSVTISYLIEQARSLIFLWCDNKLRVFNSHKVKKRTKGKKGVACSWTTMHSARKIIHVLAQKEWVTSIVVLKLEQKCLWPACTSAVPMWGCTRRWKMNTHVLTNATFYLVWLASILVLDRELGSSTVA